MLVFQSRVSGDYPDQHELILENVTMEDAGWYKCIAVNSIGRSEKKVYVEVYEDIAYSVEEPKDVLFPIMGSLVILFLVIFVGLCYYLAKYVREKRAYKRRVMNGYTKVVSVTKNPLKDPDSDGVLVVPEVTLKNVTSWVKGGQEYELPVDLNWEFSREKLQIIRYLGEGAFGEVKLGQAEGIVEKGMVSNVAVKTLKSKQHSYVKYFHAAGLDMR